MGIEQSETEHSCRDWDWSQVPDDTKFKMYNLDPDSKRWKHLHKRAVKIHKFFNAHEKGQCWDTIEAIMYIMMTKSERNDLNL